MTPTSRILTCPKCFAPIRAGNVNTGRPEPCGTCRTPLQTEVFPAMFREPTPFQATEPVVMGDEAGCFYHPQKKAVTPCQSCGRFLCALCDVDFNGQHLCPQCMETGRRKGKLKQLAHRRILYDNIALSLAAVILPVFFWIFTIITAPAALFVALWFWNAPRSIVPRSRLNYIAAITLALAQIVGWCALFYNVIVR